MANRKQHAIAVKLLGDEPRVDDLDPKDENFNARLISAFNWYTKEKSRGDSYKYHVEYMKNKRSKDDQKLFVKIDDKKVFTTYGWLARIISRGGNVGITRIEELESYLDNLLRQARALISEESTDDEEDTAPKKNVVNIQEALKLKALEYIGELEGAFDDFISGKEFSLYTDMRGKQLPAQYVQHIKPWAQSKLTEYNNVLAGKDSQLVEGYSNFAKKELKGIIKFFESIIADGEKYSQFKKANRKPRAVKVKTPLEQTKNLKYKLKDEEYNLTSARAMDIPGAEQVWLFNTKTRKLSVYTSDSTRGLEVKGSTIQNWLPEKSKQKTLRKPEEQIKDLMGAGKVKLRSFMDGIKSKEGTVNGRINIDTIILKIMR
jgi:hypothetical protein